MEITLFFAGIFIALLFIIIARFFLNLYYLSEKENDEVFQIIAKLEEEKNNVISQRH